VAITQTIIREKVHHEKDITKLMIKTNSDKRDGSCTRTVDPLTESLVMTGISHSQKQKDQFNQSFVGFLQGVDDSSSLRSDSASGLT